MTPSLFRSGVEKVEETYVQIIKLIHKDEYVNLFVKNQEMKKKVTGLLEESQH